MFNRADRQDNGDLPTQLLSVLTIEVVKSDYVPTIDG